MPFCFDFWAIWSMKLIVVLRLLIGSGVLKVTSPKWANALHGRNDSSIWVQTLSVLRTHICLHQSQKFICINQNGQ